ncbi:PREDICTED: uncharacterized protein LOC106745552 [Dinoponera quadriceps]|uniref:Uncharacterized protein LOC106745552 n=1 Tax=Dinoponera quadriceps TaxID=609295 RepID=A0A6P3XED9_DINQU|nr:PREDICTED: uncharacterized protein LOC106745552 [Dinoponera quadriceps]
MYFKTWALFTDRVIARRKFFQFKRAKLCQFERSVCQRNHREPKRERISRWIRGLQGLRFKMHSVIDNDTNTKRTMKERSKRAKYEDHNYDNWSINNDDNNDYVRDEN